MNVELQSLIYAAIREYSEGQINLASEASTIALTESICTAISKHFHIAKRRSPTQGREVKDEEQLDLFND